MRHPSSSAALLCVICACALLFAGCGADAGDEAASPLDNALGYLAEDAPLAVSVDTDISGDQYDALGKIVGKFAFGELLKDSLKESLEDEGGEFKDIEPLLGNEFVVGATSARSFAGGKAETSDFVGAIETSSVEKLAEAVKREKAEPDGEKDGAKIYKDKDGDAFAVKDAVLIVAGSRRQLEHALTQREADDRLTEEAFDEATEDLPKDALVRLSGDLEKILASDKSTKDARKINWVKALRTFGVAVSFEGDEASVDFRLDTDGEALTAEDLPFATGADAPALTDRPGEIAVGLKDPTQIFEFAERAGQAIDPSGFRAYEIGKRAIEKEYGVDIERDLLNQLRGDVAVTLAVNGNYGVRAELKDPQKFDRTLAKLGSALPDLVEGIAGEPVGYARPKKGGDFHALATASGDSVVYGVVEGVFVLANNAKTAGQLSKESTKRVPRAEGSVVLNANAEQLARQLLGQLGGFESRLAGALATGPLDELTGSMSATEDAVTGSFKLTFD